MNYKCIIPAILACKGTMMDRFNPKMEKIQAVFD